MRIERNTYMEFIRWTIIVFQVSFVSADSWRTNGALKIGEKYCPTIHGPDGQIIRTLPKFMHSFPFPAMGFKHYVCRTVSGTAGMTSVSANPEVTSIPGRAGMTSVSANPYVTSIPGTAGMTSVSANPDVTSIPELPAKVFVTDESMERIMMAELRDESAINATPKPRDIKYDSRSSRIYWTDNEDTAVYRADLKGENREMLTFNNRTGWPYAIAIAESSRILYIADAMLRKISSMAIDPDSPVPGIEADFITDNIEKPQSLMIDEEQGFLYWTMKQTVARALLNGTGQTEIIYYNADLLKIAGFSMDLTRDIRQIFFCDILKRRAFYKNATNSDTSFAVELSASLDDLHLRDVSYFKGSLYWIKRGEPAGIVIMADYDKPNRSYIFQEIEPFVYPHRMFII